MISCTKEMDEISQPITSMLWLVRNLEWIPSIEAYRLVNNVFKHCEEKLISHLHKWEKMDDNDKGDALLKENEGMITELQQEDLLNLYTTPTWGEQLKNEDVTCMDLVKTWIDQVVPKVVPVIEALSVEEVLSIVEVVSIIGSCVCC